MGHLEELFVMNAIVRRQQVRGACLAALISIGLTIGTGAISYYISSTLDRFEPSSTFIVVLIFAVFVILTIFYFRKVAPFIGFWYLRNICAKHGHAPSWAGERLVPRCIRCGDILL